MAELNSPLKVGGFEIKNRLVLAPLTRARTDQSRVPNDLMVEYYQQRANAGLLITEATIISAKAAGYYNTPGLWNEEQVIAWKKINDAVHAQHAKIAVQLWHVGRISDPEIIGDTPVSSSAVAAAGEVSLLRPKRAYVVPRALTISEIKEIIAEYKYSAQLAKQADFDAVELHAANGYLVEQFLYSNTNQRKDEYGGSIENRARFLLEVVDTLIGVWGADRVGVHLSPRGDSHDMADANRLELFSYVVEQLNLRKIAFIFAREHIAEDSIAPILRKKFSGVWIANEALTADTARQLLKNGEADAVAFGQAYIANPDLLHRLENNAPLNKINPKTLYSGSAEGYTDYPTFSESDVLVG
ncbi:alkene reductase [Acinetobacter stercoris]|uniref:N-ethylmaleimide reductase n=1 Tax=Acinetobacter stercoris TaxID=2126983 RepID=A0A2U3MYX0_9GAMM|nr:alkene reductase [Acinetobacter stercoris]SPL70601.1 N-ethylmaleimide reductase [Acinetobacter stercoris]